MPSELGTQVEQLAVVDGIKLDSAANILIGERVTKLPFARGRGRIYVLVEPLGDRGNWESICRELAQAVHDEYYQSSGSVTAGLRRALERANQLLGEMNAVDAKNASRLAGVSAVVLKGNEAFIAQTGPALVYVLHGNGVTRFPEDSPWLEMSPRQAMEQGYAAPLGLRAELSIDLFHCEVGIGDKIVLGESTLAGVFSGEELAAYLSNDTEDGVASRLTSMSQDIDVSLVVINITEQGADVFSRPTRVTRLSPFSSMTDPDSLQARRAAVTSQASEPGVKGALRKVGEIAALGAGYAADAGRVIWRRMLPGSDEARIARERRRRTRGFSLRGQGRALGDDRLLLVGMIIGVLVLAMAAYALIRWQTTRIQSMQYHRSIEAVQAKLTEAKTATDPELSRRSLQEADALLTRVSSKNADSKDVEELTRQLGDQLDSLDKVVRLYWVPQLRQYKDTGATPQRVIIHGIDIYVLDTGLGRVHKYLFNPLKDGLQELGAGVEEILLRSGDMRDNLTVGKLLDMAWVPSGPGREWASLVVLEQSGALLQYEPSSGIKVLAAGNRTTLQEPRLVAGIEGRLLVLDAKANKILVYEPTSNGYDGEGKPYTNTDLLLNGVVDMAVDGDVYLLYADGLVAKLQGGQQIPFDLTGLQTKLKNPTAIYVSTSQTGKTGYIYVADAGNQRILQFTKDGQFVRQFKPKRGDNSFANITGIAVDEDAGKMVIVSDGKLLLANLPGIGG